MKRSERNKQLVDAARKALWNSYSPYSRFRVGAAVRSKSGNIYSACNVENASYGLTICAERAAIFKMVSEGEKEIDSIAVVAETNSPITPCGACRQVINEFANTDCEIICASEKDMKIFKLGELLPYSFKPDDIS